MMFPAHLLLRGRQVLETCRARKLRLATAESCTGGLIAALLTEFPGSSDVVERGYVVYANDAKADMLGVPDELLIRHGAVSEPVARGMAEGALARSRCHIAVSVTGIAGPGGGSEAKPVGLVHLACAARGADTIHRREIYSGDRGQIRLQAVAAALDLVARQAERLSFGGP